MHAYVLILILQEATITCYVKQIIILLSVIFTHTWECFCFFSDAEQLLVLDSVPGKVNPENGDGEVEKVLETLHNLPSSVPSRK